MSVSTFPAMPASRLASPHSRIWTSVGCRGPAWVEQLGEVGDHIDQDVPGRVGLERVPTFLHRLFPPIQVAVGQRPGVQSPVHTRTDAVRRPPFPKPHVVMPPASPTRTRHPPGATASQSSAAPGIIAADAQTAQPPRMHATGLPEA
jgi:hypothetical protein